MLFLQEPRDYTISLQEQKKRLDKEYINFTYLYCERLQGVSKIVFISEGKKEKSNDHSN